MSKPERAACAALALALAATLLPAPAGAEGITLAEAVQRALRASAGTRIAQERTGQARARVGQARGRMLPTLGGTASQTERTFNLNTFGIPIPGEPLLIGPVATFDARMAVREDLLDPAGIGRLRAAQRGLVVSRGEERQADEGAAQTAALAWLRAARAAATIGARESDLALAEQLESLARDQLRAGTAANIDLLRARAQMVAARGQLLVARNESERARVELARAIGAPPDAALEPADTLTGGLRSEAPESLVTALDVALRRRPELETARARVARVRADRGAIAAERLPRLEGGADLGLSGLHASDAIQTHQWILQVTFPFLDASREQRIQEQRGLEREEELRTRDVAEQVAAEVRSSLLELSSGREQEAIARERVDLALQELSDARERFANGVAGNLEILNAQAELVRARDADIDARAASATARIHLARATGVAETLRQP